MVHLFYLADLLDDNFGPTLYDLVMSVLPNGLTPDRSDVSKEAESLWDYYANKRSDVEKSFLDDMKGIGKVKKLRIMNYFGSLKELKQTTKQELLQIDGVNTLLAQTIIDKIRNE